MEIVLESKIWLLSRKTEGRTLRVILIISQTVNLISCNKGKKKKQKKNSGEAQNNPENIILYYGITLMAFFLYIYTVSYQKMGRHVYETVFLLRDLIWFY